MNDRGSIVSGKELVVEADSAINRQGTIAGDNAVHLTVRGTIENSHSIVEAKKGLDIVAQALNNQEGSITNLDTSSLNVTVSDSLNNQAGLLGSNGNVQITAGSLTNQNGKMTAKESLMIHTAQKNNNTQGMLSAGKDLTLKAGALDNVQGRIQAGRGLSLTADTIRNTLGSVTANQNIKVTARELSNGGNILAGQDMKLEIEERLANEAGGELQADNNVTLAAKEIDNQGNVVGLQGVAISGDEVANSSTAFIKSGQFLDITSNGSLFNQGTIYAKNDVRINSKETIMNTGALAAAGNMTITSNRLNSIGTIAAGLQNDGKLGDTGDLDISTKNTNYAKGQTLAGNNLTMQGAEIAISGGSTYAGNKAVLTAITGDVENRGGSLKAKELIISTQGTVKNDKSDSGIAGSIEAEKLTITSSSISNKGGTLVQYGQKDSKIAVTGNIDNTEGKIAANSTNFTIKANTFTNRQGEVQHAGPGLFSLETSGNFDNEKGNVISNGSVVVHADEVNNTQGTIAVKKQVTLNANGLNNSQGTVTSQEELAVAVQGAAVNRQGHIEAGKGLTITAQSLDNQGGSITSIDTSGLGITVDGAIQNQDGVIGGNGSVQVAASNFDNTDGQVLAKADLKVDTQGNIDNTCGIVSAGKDLALTQTAGDFTNNQGTMQAGNDVMVNAAGIKNTAGKILANRDLQLKAQQLESSGTMGAGRDVRIDLQGSFTNESNGEIQAGRNLALATNGIITNQGKITALQDAAISGIDVTNTTGAEMKSGAATILNIQDNLTNRGTIFAKSDLVIDSTGAITNTGILAAGHNTVVEAQTVNSGGILAAGIQSDGALGSTGDLGIIASQVVTLKGQNLAGNNLNIKGTSVDLSEGTTYAGNAGTLAATAGDLNNTGGYLSAKELDITAQGAIKNDKSAANIAGSIKADTVAINSASISNKGGILVQYGQNDMKLSAAKGIDNSGGQLATNGTNFMIEADTFTNYQGQVEHAGSGLFSLKTADDVNNTGGKIVTNGTAAMDTREFNNREGRISARKELTLKADSLDNRQGVLVSQESLRVQLQGAAANQHGLMEAGKGLTVTAQSVDNNSGSITNLDASDLSVATRNEIENNSGLIGSNGEIHLNASQLMNESGQIRAKTGLNLTMVQNVDNTQGTLSAGADLVLSQESGVFDNKQGIVQAGKDLIINAATVDSSKGRLLAGRDLKMKAQTLINDGIFFGGQDIHLDVQGDFTNGIHGEIQSEGALTLTTTGSLSNQGKVTALQEAVIRGGNITNANNAAVKSGDSLNITAAGSLINEGTIVAKKDLELEAADSLINTGVAGAGNNTVIAAQTIHSTGTFAAGIQNDGSIGANGDLSIAGGDTVRAKGKNMAGSNLGITGISVDLSGGASYAGHDVTVTANDGDIDNSGATLEAKGTAALQAHHGTVRNDKSANQTAGVIKADKLALTAQNISNKGGTLVQYGQTDTAFMTNSFDNTDGQLATNGTNLTLIANIFNNNQGQVQHAGLGNLSLEVATDIDNTEGRLLTNGTAVIDSGTVINTKGTLSAGKQLALDTNSLTNQQGILVSKDDLELIVQGTVNNQQGLMEAANGLALTAQSLNNQQGSLTNLSPRDLVVSVTGEIQNQDGLIGGNGDVELIAAAVKNQKGRVQAQNNLVLTTPQGVDNTKGALSAGQDLLVRNQTGSTLVNEQGKVEAGKSLTIQAAAIRNTAGRIAANQDITLAFGELSGQDGTVQAGQDLKVDVTGAFTNETGSDWKANRDVVVSATGDITNRGSLEGGRNLSVSGSNVNNEAKGTLAANANLALNTSGDFTNTGSVFGHEITAVANHIVNANDTAAIAATGNVNLFATSSVENKDGAIIYSQGNIAIAGSGDKDAQGQYTTRTGLLLNQSADIEADGDIAIHADEVVNKKREFLTERVQTSNHVILAKKGDVYKFSIPWDDMWGEEDAYVDDNLIIWTVFGVKGVQGVIPLGQSTLKTNVLKGSPVGRIIARRNMSVFSNNTINEASYFMAGQNLVHPGPVKNITIASTNEVVNHYATFIKEVKCRSDGAYSGDMIIDDVYTETITEQLPDSNSAIFGGGKQVTIQGTDINNVTLTPNSVSNASPIRTTGHNDSAANQSGSNPAIVTGISTSVSGSGVTVVSTSSDVNSSGQAGNAIVSQAGSNIPIATGINTSVSSVGVAVNTNSGVASFGQTNSAVVNKPDIITYTAQINTTLAAGDVPAGRIQTLLPSAQTGPVTPPQTNNGGTITVPANGMYAVHTEPAAKYLVETNPRFTAFSNFISSDSMLKTLQIDPQTTMKRLGDGFYEQKLVREQINELTGRVFLSGYENSQEQYKVLLENGAKIAKDFNLQVGIALTAEQINQLTSSMVWMVEKEVNGEMVLAPVVYLPKLREGDLRADGAVIAADNVVIHASGTVNNAGTVKASSQAQIDAVTINNLGGTINGGKLTTVTAGEDLFNLSGTISGDNVQLSAGRDFKSETAAFTIDHSFHTAISSGNAAVIDAGQNLTISAGQDISLVGAKLNSGKDLSLVAGENFNITSVEEQERWGSGNFVSNKSKNLQTSLMAGKDLTFSGTGMNWQGVQAKAGENIQLTALGNVEIASVQNQDSATNQYDFNFNNHAVTSNKVSLLEAGKDLSINVKQDLNLTGAQAIAGENLHLAVGGDTSLNAVKDSAFYDVKTGSSRNYLHTMKNDETVLGTKLSAKGDISVDTGSLKLEGSSVFSEQGNIKIEADQGVTLKEVTEKHESLTESKKTKSGFLSKKTTVKRDYSLVNDVIGSNLSGEQVTVTSGADLTVKGSNILGTNGVTLTAADTISLTSAAETGASEHYSYTKKSGLFSGGGLGFTIGSQSTKVTSKEQVLGQVGSTIGSLKGDISLTAGEQVKSEGTTMVSGNDLNITGKDIILDNTINIYDSQTKFEFKQSGLSVSLKGGIVDLGTSAYNNLERSNQVQDERLKALYDYKAFKDLKKIKDQLSKGISKENLKTNVSLNVSLGSTKTTSEQTVHVETVNTSNITADGEVTIQATDGDIFLKGTKINAQDITLDAAKDIDIQSAENKQQTTTNTSSSSWSVGGSIGSGFFGNVSKGSGKENGNATTHTESILDASDTLTIKSGEDTNILGSQVKGEKVAADIKGDLNIASQQDTDDYTAKNQSSGLGFTTGLKGGITGSISQGKTDSTYASVTEQAGIYAGDGGFDIHVGKNTDLKGAVIASKATPDKNKINTDTLTYSDIQNHAEYNASSSGFSIDTKNNIPISPTPGMPVSGDSDSTTKSAVATGTIEVRSNPNQDLSTLSRDTAGALNALDKIFDKKTVQEKQELANLFGEVAFNAIGDLALSQYKKAKDKRDDATTAEEKAYYQKQMNQWDEGGANKILLHALAGGIMSDLGGNGFTSGAVSAGVNEAIQKELSNIKDPGLHQLASILIGGVAAKVVGSNESVGASITESATKNNILSHKEAKEMEDELSKCKTAEERRAVLEKWDKISKDRDAVIRRFSIEFDNAKTDEEREAICEKIRNQYAIWGISDTGVMFVLSSGDTRSDFDFRYKGLSEERKEILYKVDNAKTPGEKLKYSAQFLGQGLVEQVTIYRDSQYNLALNTGLTPELAAIAADYATWNLIGPALSTALRTGDVVGSGLGNLFSKVSSKVGWKDISKQLTIKGIDVSSWNKGSFNSSQDSVARHFEKHGGEVGAENVEQYMRKATEFAKNLRGAQKFSIDGAVEGVKRYVKNGKYIDLAPDGTIISFGKR